MKILSGISNEMNKPKLILHIGHSKTGTTSLQNYFYRNSTEILKEGYLYPIRKSVQANHILLPAGFIDISGRRLPSDLTYQDKFERFERDFLRFWNALLVDLKKYSPHTVILSAEQMFRDFSTASRMPMGVFLKQYFSGVTVVAYIRSPVPDYLSLLAQRIRIANPIPSPSARKIRGVIEYYQSQFPGCVRLHPFDRQQLRGGDILHDFFSRYVPQVLPAIEKLKLKPFNTALPWPLLRELQEIRMLTQPGPGLCTYTTRARTDWATRDYFCVHPDEKKYDVPLKADIEAFIRCSAVDYLWLKEEFGIEFPDLDYSLIDNVPNPYPADIALDRIVDFLNCPEGGLPIGRYLRNGTRLWINRQLLVSRIQALRIFRIFLRDSWLWRVKRILFRYLGNV